MNLTITSDASFSHKHEVGTYAFWASYNGGPYRTSGILRKKCKCPTEAEMKCILNALTWVTRNPSLAGVTHIFVNTDSMNSIHLFTENKKNIKRYGLHKHHHLLVKFRDLKKTLPKTEIIFSHVKAHVSTETARQFCNEWCDTAAKREMNKKLTHILQIQKKNYDKSHPHPPDFKFRKRSTFPEQKSAVRERRQYNAFVPPCNDVGAANGYLRVDNGSENRQHESIEVVSDNNSGSLSPGVAIEQADNTNAA